MFDNEHDYDEDVAFQIALLESQETARAEAARRHSNEKAGSPFNFSRGSPILDESDVLSRESERNLEDFAKGIGGWHRHTAKSEFSFQQIPQSRTIAPNSSGHKHNSYPTQFIF